MFNAAAERCKEWLAGFGKKLNAAGTDEVPTDALPPTVMTCDVLVEQGMPLAVAVAVSVIVLAPELVYVMLGFAWVDDCPLKLQRYVTLLAAFNAVK